MRRASIATLLTAILAAAVLVPEAQAAKPQKPAITGITGYSDGDQGGGNCGFYATITYTGKKRHSDTLEVSLQGWVPAVQVWSGLSNHRYQPFGRSPFTTPVFSEPLANLTSPSYRFEAYIYRGGTTISDVATGTFSMTGCPAEGTTLVTYSTS